MLSPWRHSGGRNLMSTISNVTVLGTGVLGSQIAYQTAFHGYSVTAYDVDHEVVVQAKGRFAQLAAIYTADGVAGAAEGGADAALKNLRVTADLENAVAEADLVIEAAPDNLELKRTLYRELADLA